MFLRQSTASQSVAIGPFVDETDFKTAETGLTINNTDIKIVMNGVVSGHKNSGGGTHQVNGVYGITLDATDTATVGEMEVSVVVSGALPVFTKFYVLEEAVYDALFGASAVGYVANAPVNVAQISGDSTAADNLEAQFDGTGVTGGTYPATQAQVSSIGSGTGAALNFAAAEDNASSPIKSISQVGTQTNTYANAANDNGVYHVITHATNNIDWVYGFSIGAGRSASKAVFVGYLSASAPATGKSITVQAYNFVSVGWDTVKTITGQAGTTDITVDIALLSSHTGTGSDAGKVYIRFVATAQTGAVLNTDQLYIQAQNLGQTVGYADGAIWIGGSNANTTPYIDGTADNPVTYAAALTLAASLGLTRFRVRNGTSITLTASAANKSFIGSNWALNMGNQAMDGAYIEGAEVSGSGTSLISQTEFFDCHINAGMSIGPTKFLRCGFQGTSGSPFTAASAGEFLLVDCFSEVAGSGTPYFTFAGANGVNFRRWSGGSNITLNNTSTTLTMEVLAGGGQTIAVGGADIEIRGIPRAITLTGITSATVAQINTVTGDISLAGADGTVNIYGVCASVTDSRTGSPTLTNKAVSRDNINTEADTAASDYGAIRPTVAGRTLDVSATGEAGVDWSNVGTPTATVALTNTTISGSGSSASDIAAAVWDEALAGHMAAGSTGDALFSASTGGGVAGTVELASGTVVSTTGSTTLLDSGSLATAGFYVGARLRIATGTGANQERIITDYTSGRVATHSEWTTNPDNASTYVIEPARTSLATPDGTDLVFTGAAGASEIAICNMALSHLGVGKDIANLETERGEEAAACRRFFATARDITLRDYPWPFAMKIAALALVETDPNDEWDYAYRYPSDCLRGRRILSGQRTDNRQTRVSFVIGRDSTGLLIYTDQENAELEYTLRETDPTRYPDDFVLALSLRLAALIAPRLTKGDPFKLGERALQLHAMQVGAAKQSAHIEDQPDEDPESDLIRGRE